METTIDLSRTTDTAQDVAGPDISAEREAMSVGRDVLMQAAQAITERASFDDDYREKLLQDPKTAIQTELWENGSTDQELPASIAVQVYQESSTRVYLDLNSQLQQESAVVSPIDEIVRLAASDPALAAELQRFPKETIEEILSEKQGKSFQLPAELDVEVLPEEGNTVRIILPRKLQSSEYAVDAIELGM